MKILIIDDDKTMREVLIRALSSFLKFDVFQSEDVRTASEILSKEKPSLVFLDIQIPELDVMTVLDEFKKITPDIKVVFMVGIGADDKVLTDILKQKLTGRLNKPFKLEELKSVVEKLLNIEIKPVSAPSAPPPAVKPEKKRFTLVKYFVVVIPIVLVGIFFGYKKTQRITPISFNASPNATMSLNISYISPYEDFLYVSDWMEQKIYVYTIKQNPEVFIVHKVEKNQPTAIAIASNNLWIADSLQGNISHYYLEKDRLTFVKNYRSPASSPAGIYLDGKVLWSYDINSRKIYKHSIENNLIVTHSFDMPVELPCGFTKFRGSFYLADTKTNRILKLSPDGLNLEKIFILPQYETGKEKIIAFGSDSKSFWSASENGKIYRHSPDELKSILR